MKAKQVRILMVASLSAGVLRSAEAVPAFGEVFQAGTLDSFRVHHPLAMVFINMIGIMIILGFSAIAFATLVKSPRDL